MTVSENNFFSNNNNNCYNKSAISKTWINADKGMDFDLEEYEVNCINRNNKNGGGVALYVDKNLNYKVVESKYLWKKKNVTIRCI